MIRKLSVVLASLTIAGCVSMSPEAEKVRVVENNSDVAGCQLLKSLNVHAMTDVGIANAKSALRNEAAAEGADTLLILSKVYGTGAAYRCVK